jgi:hypothetical protein
MASETTSREDERRRARTSDVARDYMSSSNGWSVVSTARGGSGMTSHRGVLYPAEYVNMAELVPAVEARLGFTVGELRTVYRQGRKSVARRGVSWPRVLFRTRLATPR